MRTLARAMLAGWANGQQAGLEFTHIFEDEPHTYAVGEIAAVMEAKLGLDHVLELLAAIRKAPRWVVHAEITKFSSALMQNIEAPPPPSYVRAMNEGLDEL